MRLFLTCFTIFIAFLIFGAVTALQGALNSGVEISADNRLITVNKINFTQPLPFAYVNKVQNIEGVKEVSYANWFGGFYQVPAKQVVTMAVDPQTYFRVYDELVIPDEQKSKWQKNRRGAVVGQRLAKTYNWKAGDTIPMSSNIFSNKDGTQTWQLQIDGIFTGKEPQTDTGYMLFHYKYFMETQIWGGDNVGWLMLTTTDANLNEQVARAIDDSFANSAAETQTSTEAAFNKAFIEQIGNIGLIIFGVYLWPFLPYWSWWATLWYWPFVNAQVK